MAFRWNNSALKCSSGPCNRDSLSSAPNCWLRKMRRNQNKSEQLNRLNHNRNVGHYNEAKLENPFEWKNLGILNEVVRNWLASHYIYVLRTCKYSTIIAPVFFFPSFSLSWRQEYDCIDSTRSLIRQWISLSNHVQSFTIVRWMWCCTSVALYACWDWHAHWLWHILPIRHYVNQNTKTFILKSGALNKSRFARGLNMPFLRHFAPQIDYQHCKQLSRFVVKETIWNNSVIVYDKGRAIQNSNSIGQKSAAVHFFSHCRI